MRLIKIIITISSLLLATFTTSQATDIPNTHPLIKLTTMKHIHEIKHKNFNSNCFITPFTNTWESITNRKSTWGPQNRSELWYIGISVSNFVNNSNSKGSNSGWNGIVGYNFNNYLAIQYNQFATYNRMLGGLTEAVLNFSNETFYTPYTVIGAGWGNITGKNLGAWDIGGGIKFQLSRHLQASIDYKYVQTMAHKPILGIGQQANAKASINMLNVSLIWFFNSNDANNINSNIKNTENNKIDRTAITVHNGKYLLPEKIQQCENNFNLTKDSVACYTINDDDIIVHLDTKFAYNSTYLNSKGKNAIDNFVYFIKNNDIKSVTIEGYASQGQIGEHFRKYNQELSEERAKTVANYMQNLGIDNYKINTQGFGYYNTLKNLDKNDIANQRVQASISAPTNNSN